MASHRLAYASAAALLTLGGCSGDDDKSTTTTPSASTTTSASVSAPATTIPATLKSAPYVDIVSGSVDISDVAAKTGQTDFTLAFVLADSTGACTPTWGGKTAIDDSTVAASIGGISTAGGSAIVATGGATGTYLETACTEDQLVTAYEKALDAAGSNRLDVDIEQSVTVETVAGALAALQKARGTAITVTLPVAGTTQGLADAGIELLEAVEDTGAEVTVNAMTMNFDAAGGGWGLAMTTAAEAVKEDLDSIWTDKSDAELYAMLGVTPMIGVNNSGGTTKTADAKYLLDWAAGKNVGFVRFWSVNRDNGNCTDGSVASHCSGMAQATYQFTDQFHDYAG
ncbi:glycosyl hydrolase [Actinoplanes sp. NPDC020271]|uniref:glycosyl hydrolase n=1 Tax=Actinoplanes sp. NPDC020271 TaxID=3363896 RepID=UPI00379C1117